MNNQIDEDLIDKVLNGIASEEEATHVAAWFATDEGQSYLTKRIDKEFYADKDFREMLLQEYDIPSDEIYRKIEKRLFVKKLLKITTYAAAIILPLILVSLGLMQLDSRVDLFGDTEYVDVYAPKGKQLQIMFQDGSIAYLNSDTKLRYPKKFGFLDRKIYLDGEAYFEIEKNRQRPFIVEMDSVSVRVLGTSFNLEGYSGDRTISIILDEGEVNLKPNSIDKKYTLDPGEKMIYDKYNGSCIILANNSYISPALWKDDVVYLKNKPLQDVLNVLDRKYDVRFQIEDEDALKYSYTILISKDTPIERVIEDLEKIAPVKFIMQEELIIVKIDKK